MGIRRAPKGVDKQQQNSINAMDGAGEVELTQLEHATEGNVIVYNSSQVATAGPVTIATMNSAAKTYVLSYKHEGSADTAGTDWERTMFVVPFAGELVDADIVSDVGFGQDTNYSSLAVVNKGQNGSGTTSMAAKDFNATNATTAYKSHLITLSGTPANKTVAEGDVIAIKKTHTGNGQAVPDHAITIKIARTA